MTEEMPEGWSDFFIATAGAAGALAGLIIVAMTVNITTIISIPSMTSRAAATIASLVLIVPMAKCCWLRSCADRSPDRPPTRNPRRAASSGRHAGTLLFARRRP